MNEQGNNYGGNKSGLFNDVIEVEDGYIVCGRDAANYGIIIKIEVNNNCYYSDELDLKIIMHLILILVWKNVFPYLVLKEN